MNKTSTEAKPYVRNYCGWSRDSTRTQEGRNQFHSSKINGGLRNEIIKTSTRLFIMNIIIQHNHMKKLTTFDIFILALISLSLQTS